MKHLYNLNSNKSLLNRTLEISISDSSEVQKEKDKDFLLLSVLNLLNDDNEVEPDNNIIEYLLNYSKSIDVQKLKNSKYVCVFNKN